MASITAVVKVSVDSSPPRSRVVRPAAMVVRFEARVQRALPIEARFEGEPQTGYRVTQVTVDPPEATVVGAQSVVEALEKVQTERISLVGRSQTTTIDVPLSAPPAYASYRDRGREFYATADAVGDDGEVIFRSRDWHRSTIFVI